MTEKQLRGYCRSFGHLIPIKSEVSMGIWRNVKFNSLTKEQQEPHILR